MLAGISLVKAGQRSFDLIAEKLTAGKAGAPLVRLLPDIDAGRSRAVLKRIMQGETGEVADAAKQCVELLDRIDEMQGDSD